MRISHKKGLWMVTGATLLAGYSTEAAATEKPGLPKNTAVKRDNSANRLTVAQILGIKTLLTGKETFVEIMIKGNTAPILTQNGKRVTLMLPDSIPALDLASHLESGGIVSRIGVELTNNSRASRLTFELTDDASCFFVSASDKKNLRLRIVPEATEKLEPTFTTANGLFDVDAYQTDLASLLTSLAKSQGGSVAMLGVSPKVTAQLKGVTFEQAVGMLAKSAGMTARKEGETFIVGGEKEMATAYPVAKPQDPSPAVPVMKQAVYRCRYITSGTLVRSVQGMFETTQLKVTVGADHASPTLMSSSGGSGSVTGLSSSALASASSGSGGSGASASSGTGGSGGATAGTIDSLSREVIFYGEQTIVDRALDLAAKLDLKRKQVRINVTISDVNSNALKELGLRWSWSDYTATENATNRGAASGSSTGGTTATATASLVNGFGLGSFSHSPVYVNAKLSALEQDNKAKTLANPSLMLLDGERGFIQIGQRVLYPVVVSLSQNNQPNYSVQEQRVGIYLQIAVSIDDDDTFTLTLYPQVSSITSYLTVNGGSYPQISTREAQTTVRLKSGQVIAIGGLIQDSEISQKDAVPILSKIPFFGELFKYRKKTHDKSEVIVTIDPEILKD